MYRFVFITALAGVAAVYASGRPDLLDRFAPAPATSVAAEAPEQPTATPVSLSEPGAVSIPAGANGHFQASFKINGREVDGLVDTGATYVAMNEATARRVGVSLSSLDYRYAVTTANGATQAAYVTLGRVDIGGLHVRDVDAFVLKDKSLSGMLVGMSFMSKLKTYKVENGVLYLKN